MKIDAVDEILNQWSEERPELDTARITGMGLMIYDKQDGPFALRLASVKAYANDRDFSLSAFRWDKRVLVISAAALDDRSLSEQQDDLAATAEQFADRDMVLVTLLDDAVSTAADRALTSNEVSKAREQLEIAPGSFSVRLIGKDGSVKLARNEVTPMANIYALIDSMPMRRAEMREKRAAGQPVTVVPVDERLEDEDWWLRVTAAETLGRFKDTRAVDALVKTLNDPEARWAAVEALGQIGHSSALPVLGRLLKDPAPEIRIEALLALRNFNHPKILEAIRKVASSDPERGVRAARYAGCSLLRREYRSTVHC